MGVVSLMTRNARLVVQKSRAKPSFTNLVVTVLRKCNYFFGSSSDFWQVPVLVPTPYLNHKKHNIWKKSCFLHIKLFYEETKIDKSIKFIVKCEWKKMIQWRKSNKQFQQTTDVSLRLRSSSGSANVRNYTSVEVWPVGPAVWMTLHKVHKHSHCILLPET